MRKIKSHLVVTGACQHSLMPVYDEDNTETREAIARKIVNAARALDIVIDNLRALHPGYSTPGTPHDVLEFAHAITERTDKLAELRAEMYGVLANMWE